MNIPMHKTLQKRWLLIRLLSCGDLWKQVFPFGREWDDWYAIHRYEWDFSNLLRSLEEGGELYGQNVYLFGSSDLNDLVFRSETRYTRFPIVFAVVSSDPPCDKLLIDIDDLEIIPMEEMNVGWIPYFPPDASGYQVKKLNSQTFILGSKERRSGSSKLKTKFYNPCFHHPFPRYDTTVDIEYPGKLKLVSLKFNYAKKDCLQDLTERLIEEGALTGDEKDAFQNFVKHVAGMRMKTNILARVKQKKAEEEEQRSRFQEMKFFRFYPVPSPCTPDASKFKNPHFNKYVLDAHVL